MPLSDLTIRRAKPRERAYKLADEKGLYLYVQPSGARYWRLKYRWCGKEKVLALGVYDAVSLAEARTLRYDAKKLLRDGKDPGAVRKVSKLEAKRAAGNTFRIVAAEWIHQQRRAWDPGHADGVEKSLELHLYPDLGDRPIDHIEPPELLAVLRKIERRGTHEARQRAQQRAGAVFKYGVATGRCSSDPTRDLKRAFTSPTVNHHAALDKKDLPEFFEKLGAYDLHPQTKLAIRFLALTAVRTGELRGATWDEIDLKDAEWRIPAERMKMGEPHIVPLSTQALAVLAELQELNGDSGLLFRNVNNPAKSMSENTILYGLYRMGYHGRATGHGFRSTFSTMMNEYGFKSDWIERQLAHGERNQVRAAYNRATYLAERRKMMQHWGDVLEGLAAGAKVVPLKRAG